MPTHQRQTIREAVKAQLLGPASGEDPPVYVTSAGARVYETRMIPWREIELPAIAIYTLDETVDPDSKSTSPRRIYRTMQLEIVAAARASNNVDDDLDTLAMQIEAAMNYDETLGGSCGDSILSATEMAIESVGNKPIGMVRMVYSVSYEYQPQLTGTPVTDDLSTVATNYSLSGDQATADQAKDLIEDLEE